MKNTKIGTCYAIDILGCEYEQLEDYTYLIKIFQELIAMLNYKIMNMAYHKFEPQGFSCVFIISASHLTIHTWPEAGYLGIDLFTCSDLKSKDIVIDFLNNKIKNTYIKIEELKRGI